MKTRLSLLVALLALCGCPDSNRHPGMQAPTKPQVSATANVSADDFDLGLLSQLINENKIPGGLQEIEAYINDPDHGINYVDQDKDNKIDYVAVVETKTEDGSKQLDFQAFLSSKPEQEPISIATMNIKAKTVNGSQEVFVEAGYPSYIHGYQDHYYSYHRPYPVYRSGMSLGEAYLFSRLLSPHYVRPLYVSPFYTPSYRVGFSYSSRPSMAVRTSTRTTTRTRTSVSPVKRAARPTNFRPSQSAQRTASRYATRRTSNSGTSNFNARNSNRTKKPATGFQRRNTGSSNTNTTRSKPKPRTTRSKPRPRPRPRSRSRSRRR